MINKKKVMDEIAYKYYPKGISVLEYEQYLESDANKRLIAIIKEEEA